MKPESITVYLETAKKLKEAGWSQTKCEFYWIDLYIDDKKLMCKHCLEKPFGSYDEIAAAPTAEEILRELPKMLEIDNEWYHISIRSDSTVKDHWYISYLTLEKEKEKCFQQGSNGLANAAAEMWIYLKTNNLL